MAKGDLRLMGEIDKRVEKLEKPGKLLLVTALADGIPQSEVELVRQIVERFGELTFEGKQYVDKKLGVDRGE